MWKWVAGLALLGCVPVSAEAQDARPLTLERVFASPDLAGSTPRAMKLSPDGKWLTLLRNRPEQKDRFDLWAMDTSTGAWRMLVDSLKVGTGAKLSEAEMMQMERARIAGTKGITAYDWSPDSNSILVPLEGELYLATLDGQVTRLQTAAAPKLNAEISPKGGYISYVQGQNLIVGSLHSSAGGAIT